ncbi:MAG: hypothetical protein NT018_00695 [Armatimonadetes bacterium]|nr:hypothetical protein [Armatimonadota bacterium]
MKTRSVLLGLVLMLVACAGWAQDKPADLPVFKGGEVTMEINLGNADIIPTLNAILPLMSDNISKIMQGVNPDDLAAVLKDVTQIEMIQVEVAKSSVSESEIASFYGKNIPEGKWSRVFWQSKPKGGVLAIYVQSGLEAIYGYKVETKNVDGKPVKRAQIAKIKGKIDFLKLISIASKIAIEQHSAPAAASGN